MDPNAQPTVDRAYDFADFTEQSYRSLLERALSIYAFESFGTTSSESHVLWRHDVDFSVHRALKLAQIEAELGARATYYVRLRASFYNLLERPVLERAREIAALGHDIGLHFDPIKDDLASSKQELVDALASDRDLLANALGVPVESFSFHNAGVWGADAIVDDQLAGMHNASGPSHMERYQYVSDSNGYWGTYLPDVLADPPTYLHVLTHPDMWQETAMSPRARMMRSIDGRAAHTIETYEGPARAHGRAIIE